MVKTVFFDVPASFIIGMLVPLACPRGIGSSHSLLANKYLLATVLFELFFFMPLGAYLYYYHPDWSLMYFLDPAGYQEPTLRMIGLSALGSYLGASVSGFWLGAWMIKSDREQAARVVMLSVLLALAVFSAVTFRRLMSVGLYSDWIAPTRTTVPLHLHLIGYVTAIVGTVAGAVLIMMVRTLRRDERTAQG